MDSVLFSSKSSEWETPQWLYDKLWKKYRFVLDPCCTYENCKCRAMFTKKDDGLSKNWAEYGNVFMNPPYGREIYKWVKKAYEEAKKGITVVCLLPSRTDTKWWHEYVMRSQEIRFIRGRLKFQGAKYNAPFPSAVVVFRA